MAKLTREAVINHLKRIHADGLINEVYLEPDFSCLAKVEEGDFYLSAPALGKKKFFPNRIGLPKLDLVLGGLIGFAEDDELEPTLIDINDGVDQGTDLTFALNDDVYIDWARRLTLAPPVTQVAPESAQAVVGAIGRAVEAGRWTTITSAAAAKILRGMSLLPSERTQMMAHRKGLYFRVGDMFTKARTKKFPIDADITPDLIFDVKAAYLAAVLKQIPEDGEARLTFSDTHPGVVGVEIEGYMYAIGSKEAVG